MDPSAVRRRRVLLSITALALSSLLLGSVFEPTSLGQLTRRADLIVRGQVQGITSGPRGETGPTTTVAILVREQWKGQWRSTLSLLQPRGTEAGIAQEVPGLPTFHLGEDVVLFLIRGRGGYYEVLGGRQGKLSIKTGPDGKELVEDLTGSRLDLGQFVRRLKPATKLAP